MRVSFFSIAPFWSSFESKYLGAQCVCPIRKRIAATLEKTKQKRAQYHEIT